MAYKVKGDNIMTVVETLNNKLSLGGKVDSPFYFTGSDNMVILRSTTWGGAAYPMFISFDLTDNSVSQAINQVKSAFDYAIRSDLIHSTKPFYQEFEKAIIDILTDLKISLK